MVVPIPPRDRISLGTWPKWKIYGRFPFKLLFHVILLISSTWLILSLNGSDSAYYRAARRNWYYYFFPSDYDFESKTFYIYTVNETLDSLSRIIKNFDDIIVESVDQLSHGTGSHSNDVDVEVYHFSESPKEMFKYPHSHFNSQKQTTHLWLNSSFLGPFDLEKHSYVQVSNFVQSIIWMKIRLVLVSHGTIGTSHECLIWQITLDYDFKKRGQFKLGLFSDVLDDCTADYDSLSAALDRGTMRLHICIIFSALALLGLNMRSSYQSLTILRKVRNSTTPRPRGGALRRRNSEDAYNTSQLNEEPLLETIDLNSRESIWAQLSWSDRIHFFNMWFVVVSAACVALIVFSLLSLFQEQQFLPTDETHKLLLGGGCSILWVGITNYLSHNPSYYTIVLTLKRAVPRVAKFLLGVMPLFLAYAFFGTLYFGSHSDRFGSFADSFVTLFAILNGDVIRETFMDIMFNDPVVSQLYLYSFVCLFIYVVLNVFIAIVEESFFSTRSKPRSLVTFANRVQGEIIINDADDGSDDGASLASSHTYEWGTDVAHPNVAHRKLKWLRNVLDSLENN